MLLTKAFPSKKGSSVSKGGSTPHISVCLSLSGIQRQVSGISTESKLAKLV